MSHQDSISTNPFVKGTNLNVGIIGCGWLGQHIAKHLVAHHHIFTTTTSTEKNATLLAQGYESTVIKFAAEENTIRSIWKVLHQLDVIIITVPFSKRDSAATLLNRFKHLCQFIHGFDKQVFLLSSIGIYPETPIAIWENTLPNEELNASMLTIEQLVQRSFPQVNILRLGGLMGGSRVFSNYNVEPTQQVVNHVHYQDICLIIEKMMVKNSAAKMYHVVAPMHPTKEEVLAYQKNKQHVLSENPFGKIVHSDAVQQELDYRFVHTDPRMFE